MLDSLIFICRRPSIHLSVFICMCLYLPVSICIYLCPSVSICIYATRSSCVLIRSWMPWFPWWTPWYFFVEVPMRSRYYESRTHNGTQSHPYRQRCTVRGLRLFSPEVPSQSGPQAWFRVQKNTYLYSLSHICTPSYACEQDTPIFYIQRIFYVCQCDRPVFSEVHTKSYLCPQHTCDILFWFKNDPFEDISTISYVYQRDSHLSSIYIRNYMCVNETYLPAPTYIRNLVYVNDIQDIFYFSKADPFEDFYTLSHVYQGDPPVFYTYKTFHVCQWDAPVFSYIQTISYA